MVPAGFNGRSRSTDVLLSTPEPFQPTKPEVTTAGGIAILFLLQKKGGIYAAPTNRFELLV